MPASSRRRVAPLLALCLAALALPGIAAAQDPPALRAILDRYLEVSGGAAAVMSEKSAHAVGRLTAFGLTGTVEQWNVRPDHVSSVTSIGPFTLKQGCDGQTAWRVDQNGKFALRDGKDLEDEKASAWFVNEMWLMPGHGGGTVTLVGSEKDSAGSYHVVEVTPPAGRSRRMWFSDKTGLIDREVSRQDTRTSITRLSDYRRLAGRVRACRTTIEVEGMPMNSATATIDSMWVNLEIAPAVFSGQASSEGDTRFVNDQGPARIPFRYRARHVWLKASINGLPPEDFLLDTGASITVIDSAYAAAHGIRAEGRLQAAGAGAAGGASLSGIDSMRVDGEGGGVRIGAQKVAVLSLNAFLEPFFWTHIAGVLGYDFISRFVTEVDFDRRLLTLNDPKTFQYAGRGKAVPMTMAGNIPVVKAKLDDRLEGEFRLDVGSGSTVDLHGPFVKKNGLRDGLGTHYEIMGGGFGGTFSSTVCRMKKMAIGDYAWTDPVVILSGASEGGLASEDYAGNIGNQVMERFKVTFDYERRQVWLEPGARFAGRDIFSRAGFGAARYGDRVLAIQVLAGSPGAKAGLRDNDQLKALDGKPILSYDIEDLRKIFEEGAPGEKHVLDVTREGKGRKLKLVLADLL